MPTEVKESSPIKVHFKTGIRADGDLISVRVTQFEQQIQLTEKQAISLAKQLLNRFASDLLVE